MTMHISSLREPTAPVFVEKVKNLQSKAHFSNPIQSSLLPTPVKFEVLNKYLEGFDEKKREILETGFRDGFIIFFDGDECELECSNSKAANQLPDAVNEKVKKEFEKGRIAGPFTEKPFDNFKCSPLSIREKQTKGQYRLLHNLSYLYDQRSVNLNISKESKIVHYSSVSDGTELIRSIGKGCFLAKSDISEAFRLLPLHPDCLYILIVIT